MREDASLIDKFSDSMDNMWASVLNEYSDDEDGFGFMGRCASPPPSELDIQLDKSLSYVDEETVQGLGCMFDGLLLAMTPDEEELMAVKKIKPMPIKPVPKKGRDLGLPPRPYRKRATRPKPKPQVEKRQDTKEENEGGFLSNMFGRSENEARDESQEPSTDTASIAEDEGDMDPVPLTRRISFRRVSSSFRRKESARSQNQEEDEDEDEDDFFGGQDQSPTANEARNETSGSGLMAFMFGTQDENGARSENKVEPPERKRDETNYDADEDDDNQSIFSFLLCTDDEDTLTKTSTKSKNKASLAKKFARPNGADQTCDESVATGSLSSIRLVKRPSFRRERNGKRPPSLRTINAEEF